MDAGHTAPPSRLAQRRSQPQRQTAAAVEQAVAHVLDAGLRTADIAAPGEQAVGTRAMGDAVIDALQAKGGKG